MKLSHFFLHNYGHNVQCCDITNYLCIKEKAEIESNAKTSQKKKLYERGITVCLKCVFDDGSQGKILICIKYIFVFHG